MERGIINWYSFCGVGFWVGGGSFCCLCGFCVGGVGGFLGGIM